MNETEIIMDETVVDEVMEVIPENTGVNFAKVGFGILVVGAAIALGYKGYKLIKEKKARKMQETDCVATVEAEDFEDEESAE